MTTRPRAALYYRISEKDRKIDKVDIQHKRLLKAAAAADYHVAAVFMDDGISADSGKTRPAFLALMNGIRRREFDVVMTVTPDRFVQTVTENQALQIVCAQAGILAHPHRRTHEPIIRDDESHALDRRGDGAFLMLARNRRQLCITNARLPSATWEWRRSRPQVKELAGSAEQSCANCHASSCQNDAFVKEKASRLTKATIHGYRFISLVEISKPRPSRLCLGAGAVPRES